MTYSVKSLPNKTKFKIRNGKIRFIDEYAINEIWDYKFYNPSGFSINKLGDIDTHVSSFTVYAGKKARKGRVHVFGLNSENPKLLKENVKLNNLKNVQVFNLCIAGRWERK